jgi:hypothetical protein
MLLHMPIGGNHAEAETLARRRSHRAYGAAMVAAFQVLVSCLEERGALLPGHFPDALRVYDACDAP